MYETNTSPFSRYLMAELAAPGSDTFVDGPFGSSIKSQEYVDAGVRLIQLQNVGEGEWRDENKKFITTRKFRSLERHGAIPGDIAIAKMAEPVARACLVPPVSHQFVVVADCIRLRLDETRFDPGFVVRAINSPYTRREAEKKSIGSTRVRINLSVLKTIGCLAPALPEQQTIARVLDTLDTAIHETEAIIAKLKAVKQGLLHDLLTRGIDANGELRPSQAEAPHLYKQSPLGWIPKEWEVCALAECAQVSSGVTLGRALSGRGSVELPYLRVANVQDGYVDLTDVKTVRVLADEIDRFALIDGDVLMNEGGDFDKLGRGTVWRAQIAPCLHQNHVFRVRCVPAKLIPDYLAAYSASHRGKAFFVQSSKQSTNLASINSTQLKSFPLVRPSVTEQGLIIARLDTIANRLSAEELHLQKLGAVKAGLMDDLLTGRVRVTPLLQEPATA